MKIGGDKNEQKALLSGSGIDCINPVIRATGRDGGATKRQSADSGVKFGNSLQFRG